MDHAILVEALGGGEEGAGADAVGDEEKVQGGARVEISKIHEIPWGQKGIDRAFQGAGTAVEAVGVGGTGEDQGCVRTERAATGGGDSEGVVVASSLTQKIHTGTGIMTEYQIGGIQEEGRQSRGAQALVLGQHGLHGVEHPGQHVGLKVGGRRIRAGQLDRGEDVQVIGACGGLFGAERLGAGENGEPKPNQGSVHSVWSIHFVVELTSEGSLDHQAMRSGGSIKKPHRMRRREPARKTAPVSRAPSARDGSGADRPSNFWTLALPISTAKKTSL